MESLRVPGKVLKGHGTLTKTTPWRDLVPFCSFECISFAAGFFLALFEHHFDSVLAHKKLPTGSAFTLSVSGTAEWGNAQSTLNPPHAHCDGRVESPHDSLNELHRMKTICMESLQRVNSIARRLSAGEFAGDRSHAHLCQNPEGLAWYLLTSRRHHALHRAEHLFVFFPRFFPQQPSSLGFQSLYRAVASLGCPVLAKCEVAHRSNIVGKPIPWLCYWPVPRR